jgi:hypothetical protein
MSYDKNAFTAQGTAPHEDFDFKAVTGDKKTWAPTWGFLTENWSPLVMFRIGGSFGGFYYGVQGYGGDPDDAGNIGPDVNEYSDFAGVFGTGVYVTGVAGTSVNNVGVYGQSGNDPVYLKGLTGCGVLGASDVGAGVVGWSDRAPGAMGFSYSNDGVDGVSSLGKGVSGLSDQSVGVGGLSGNDFGVLGVSHVIGPQVPDPTKIGGVWGSSDNVHGVIGTSTARIGVYGYSANDVGIFGSTGNPTSYAGFFDGTLGVNGNLNAHVKNAIVPFPDGSKRLLHCMESPEHWFEDFGSAKLARGRAVVKLDANFAKVIKRGDYRVFVTPEGDCHGLYIRRKAANSFTVRELKGGKSSITFSYRIVGRRKDIKEHRRFAKIDIPPRVPTRPPRGPRKLVPTAAGLRAFVARVEKEARERAPKGVEKVRARMRARSSRPPVPPR